MTQFIRQNLRILSACSVHIVTNTHRNASRPNLWLGQSHRKSMRLGRNQVTDSALQSFNPSQRPNLTESKATKGNKIYIDLEGGLGRDRWDGLRKMQCLSTAIYVPTCAFEVGTAGRTGTSDTVAPGVTSSSGRAA